LEHPVANAGHDTTVYATEVLIC